MLDEKGKLDDISTFFLSIKKWPGNSVDNPHISYTNEKNLSHFNAYYSWGWTQHSHKFTISNRTESISI